MAGFDPPDDVRQADRGGLRLINNELLVFLYSFP
jgi:hypothetical protein